MPSAENPSSQGQGPTAGCDEGKVRFVLPEDVTSSVHIDLPDAFIRKET